MKRSGPQISWTYCIDQQVCLQLTTAPWGPAATIEKLTHRQMVSMSIAGASDAPGSMLCTCVQLVHRRRCPSLILTNRGHPQVQLGQLPGCACVAPAVMAQLPTLLTQLLRVSLLEVDLELPPVWFVQRPLHRTAMHRKMHHATELDGCSPSSMRVSLPCNRQHPSVG